MKSWPLIAPRATYVAPINLSKADIANAMKDQDVHLTALATGSVAKLLDDDIAAVPASTWNVPYDAQAWAAKAWANVILGLQTILNYFEFTTRNPGGHKDVNAATQTNADKTGYTASSIPDVTLVASSDNADVIGAAVLADKAHKVDGQKIDGKISDCLQGSDARLPSSGVVAVQGDKMNLIDSPNTTALDAIAERFWNMDYDKLAWGTKALANVLLLCKTMLNKIPLVTDGGAGWWVKSTVSDKGVLNDAPDVSGLVADCLQGNDNRIPVAGKVIMASDDVVTLDNSTANKTIIVKSLFDIDINGWVAVAGSIADWVWTILGSSGQAISDLANRVKEIWQIKGLDSANPLTVDKTAKQITVDTMIVDIDETDPTKEVLTRE